MRLYVLDLGKLVMVGDNPVTDGNDSEEPVAVPVSAFLIDSPSGKILFDTGCHPEAMEGAWPKELTVNPYVCPEGSDLISRLTETGTKPEEIKYVVASHLHLDHGGGIHFFPQATVLVQEYELEKTIKDCKDGCLDFFHLECDVKNWAQAGTKWRKISSEEPVELCEGVKVFDLKKGHSFGMLAMEVKLECGTFILASDAAYSAAHYGPPTKLSGEVYDERGYFEAISTLRSEEKATGGKVLFGHDMAQFETLIKSQDGFYQ